VVALSSISMSGGLCSEGSVEDDEPPCMVPQHDSAMPPGQPCAISSDSGATVLDRLSGEGDGLLLATPLAQLLPFEELRAEDTPECDEVLTE